MELLNGDGTPMKKPTAEAPRGEDGQPLSTEECGKQLAHFMITKAGEYPTNESINKQFDILRHAALNILAHRVVNVALGFGETAITINEWDNSRAFAYEKELQENLSDSITEWKTQFMNGELQYHPSKPT